jgi:Biotin-requiring enzyme/e3 binding domain
VLIQKDAYFSHSSILHAASSFKMPAMSPTMTEGNIASWKVKEGAVSLCDRLMKIGESFSAGDVLLEIETDKAQMDVEAQDDGILAKIIVPNGTHNVKVGKTIAVLAEEGDDISSVEIPAEHLESTSAAPSASKVKEKTSRDEQPRTGSTDHKARLHFADTYPPAVLRLLQEHGIEDPKRITATGPQGRLLKGDVLAYVGTIASDIPKTLKEILLNKQHLDLSNISVQRPQVTLSLESSIPSPTKIPIPAHIDAIVRLTELFKMQRQLSSEHYSLLLLIIESFSLEKPINLLVEKACSRALEDVPRFGLRKVSDADLVFAELIGERPTMYKISNTPSQPQLQLNLSEPISPLPDNVQIYRSKQ